jgi:hypothetical protein
MKKPGITTVTDNVKALREVVAALTKNDLLIGIPDDKDGRKSEDGDIGNAGIGFVQENGEPENNLPKRPFLHPGFERAKPAIVEELKAGGTAAMTIIVKQEGFEPLADTTLYERARMGFSGTKALIRSAQLLNSITFVIRGRKRGSA